MGKLLFWTMSSFGHLNAGTTLAQCLLSNYGSKHEIIFILDQEHGQRVQTKCPGIKIRTYTCTMVFGLEQKNEKNSAEKLVSIFLNIFI